MIQNLYITNRFTYFIVSIILIFQNQLMSKDDSNSIQKSVATFSIVACDTTTKELGIAVASRFFAVGSVVPWAKAEVGAVATQSFANTSFGWLGLGLLKIGLTPDDVLDSLLKVDNRPEKRQVGIVSFYGLSATYTGEECLAWAGGKSGPNYAIQGNILASEDVITSMEQTILRLKVPWQGGYMLRF